MITKSMSRIDFSESAEKIHNKIRAITGYAFIDGKRLKVFRSVQTGTESSGQPGLIENVSEFMVVCGDGKLLKFTEVQPEGGKRMMINDYLRGNKIPKGTVLRSDAESL